MQMTEGVLVTETEGVTNLLEQSWVVQSTCHIRHEMEIRFLARLKENQKFQKILISCNQNAPN